MSKRERTRAAILDTALELFAADGYEGTSMADVAAAAGVVRQTVLNHYPRKDDLVLAWGERRRRLIDAAAGSVAAGRTATERLTGVYRALAGINEAERDLARALHPHYEAIARRRVVPDSVLAAVEHGLSTGELDAGTPATTIGEVLTAVYFDTLSRWLDSADPADLTTLLLERIELVLRGARTPDRP
ncbi:hypothetical protein GCM10017691_55590 [Pseudonocardia petroleophila]|uniref:TetR/AcrR family transcriptional regulator n=1 Tax=Pseudonocardia petroleophila TaxID=37331 RepID=A0A7G7MNK8_9PSEU|nr:TetR/AcrR family transcriptional regulator [Pseudonocardia petroleophila]QNG54369.1 TetR/AcrR family transcriptional regulator [Pseudonocardia petroleophila]